MAIVVQGLPLQCGPGVSSITVTQPCATSAEPLSPFPGLQPQSQLESRVQTVKEELKKADESIKHLPRKHGA